MKRENPGKQFEADFKGSIPTYAWLYRFKDGTASWGSDDTVDVDKLNNELDGTGIKFTKEQLIKMGVMQETKTRFQASNICDFQLYNFPTLYLLELKSTKQKSL